MHTVTYSMNLSVDGFIIDADGRFDWADPHEDVFRAALDELRGVGTHLLGRRLYETMLYWETAEPDTADEVEWAALWKAVPKVVFSKTLTAVEGTNTRLASRGLAHEMERLRAEPGDGDIAIGGAALAADAASLDLIDEYRPRVHPVLVGGGIPFFPQAKRHVKLELVESRVTASRVVFSSYRVVR